MFVIGENLENRFTVETLEKNGHFSSLYVTFSLLIDLNKNRTYFIISKGTTFDKFLQYHGLAGETSSVLLLTVTLDIVLIEFYFAKQQLAESF